MSEAKRHHYVPQFHLRRFCNDDGKLWVWDSKSDRVFPSDPAKVAAENQFYRLTQYEKYGHDPLTMEQQFSAMEGEASQISAQWIQWLPECRPGEKIAIPPMNRWIMARFLALQVIRTLDMRELLSALLGLDKQGQLSDEEGREIHTEVLWNDQLVARITRRFENSIWIFARIDTDVFLKTSDNPVLFRSADNRQWLRSVVVVPEVYVCFNLSPKIVLYCYPKIRKFRNLERFADSLSPVLLTREMVESENSGQVFMSSRFVFSCEDNFMLEKKFKSTIGADINASNP